MEVAKPISFVLMREREREREREGGNKKRADMFRVAMGFIFRAYYSKL